MDQYAIIILLNKPKQKRKTTQWAHVRIQVIRVNIIKSTKNLNLSIFPTSMTIIYAKKRSGIIQMGNCCVLIIQRTTEISKQIKIKINDLSAVHAYIKRVSDANSMKNVTRQIT